MAQAGAEIARQSNKTMKEFDFFNFTYPSFGVNQRKEVKADETWCRKHIKVIARLCKQFLG
jgi:hypothetical protein